jgi:hypothetical protein
MTAPNAGRGLHAQRPQSQRRRRLLAQWLRSLLDSQDCAARIPTQIQDGSSGADSLVSEIANRTRQSWWPPRVTHAWSHNQCGEFRVVKEIPAVAF